MTTVDQELIDIALEALSNHKIDIDKSKKDISTVKSAVTKVDSVLKADIGKLSNKLSVIDNNIPNLVKEEVAKIPIPKNGRDGKDFDVEAVKPIIADKVQEVEKKAIDKVHKAIKAIPKPKDGKDGRNGLNGKSGKDGRDGKSIKGDKGSKGVPGVGIEDITAKDNKMQVKLTDGKVKEVVIPKFVAPSTGVVAPAPVNPEIQTLRNLADTAVNNVEEGQTLVYNNGKWVPGDGAGSYTNLTPVPTKLGGVEAGTVFDSIPISEVLDMLLYPYLAPSFTSFTGISGPIEVGNTLDVGTVTLSWSTSNSSNINPDTIDIEDVTRSLMLAEDIANDGSEDVLVAPITYTTPAQHTWRISAVSVKSATFSRTMKVNWYSAIYYGESPLDTLTGVDVPTLRKKVLAANSSNIYDLLGGDYKWICYPTSMGLKTIFKDISTNFDVAMNPVETVSVTNDFGVTQDYYCHRTYNILGGNISIGMS